MERFYKLALPSGFDFYTGETINYRENIGKFVSPPNKDKTKGLCSDGVIHASRNINDCFVGAKIPCSGYIVEGKPLVEDSQKCGFIRLKVIEEIADLDTAFGWKYSEVINPINPFEINAVLTDRHKELLMKWDSIRNSIRRSIVDSIRNSIWDSIVDSIWDSIVNSIGYSIVDSIVDSIGNSIVDSIGNSIGYFIWNSIWVYAGSIFPNIKKWEYIDHEDGIYPFQSCVDLWKDGFVPSFDGKIWRLHAGIKADIVYKYEPKQANE